MRAGKDRPKTGNNPEHQNETFLTYSTIYVAFKTNRVTWFMSRIANQKGENYQKGKMSNHIFSNQLEDMKYIG